jgi:transglutaminase-like putative cysteine protease
VLLFEPAGTLNTDGVKNEQTLDGRVCPLALVLLVLGSASLPASEVQIRSRTFELTYKATVRNIPEGTKVLDLWLPVPQTDRNQIVHRVTIDAQHRVSIGREPQFGNHSLNVRVDRPTTPVTVTLTLETTRWESTGSNEVISNGARAEYLKPEALVPLDGPVRSLALEAIRGLDTDAEKAKAIYEKVVGLMKYDKSGTGWGRGDALFACDAKRGNCTDFHALVIGMARSVGIPARFAIGLPLPHERGTGDILGYHCWAELYVRGSGWVPVDASEAAKDPTRRGYFFGHHDEDRLEFSRGRHVKLHPAQKGPPLNFFVYPYAELDGSPHDAIDRKFTFTDRGK